MKRSNRRCIKQTVQHVMEPLQPRQLLAAATVPIALNPINLKPISDPDYSLIPTPRIVLGLRGTLEVFAPNSSDEIRISIQQINGANRVLVQVNDRSRAVRLRDVKRFTIIGDGGLDNPDFFPQRGADEITITGPAEFLRERKISIFGDNVQPAIARVDQAGNMFNFDGDDTLIGAAFGDNIAAGAGNNFVDGGGGNDRITSLEGIDTIIGGGGNDTIDSGAGADSITGDIGDDSINGGADPDTIYGGDGNDAIDLGAMSAGLIKNFTEAGAGNDTIVGSNFDDLIFAGAGNDSVNGSFGNDSILAGAGNDSVDGGLNFDTIYGEEGDDTLKGDQGFINGRAEPIEPENSDDRIFGGPGNDYLWGESGDDQVSGGDGADILLGQFGTDRLDGGGGNDYLNGHEGNDRVVGGKGRDTYNLADFEARADTNFRAGQTDFSAGEDNPNREVRPYRLTLQSDNADVTKESVGRFDYMI